MSAPPPPRTSAPSRRTWVLICLLLAPAVIVPLLVGLYDSQEPRLLGFPFYFWFQMALIPAAVLLTVIAYYLAKGADRRDREWRAAGGDRDRNQGEEAGR